MEKPISKRNEALFMPFMQIPTGHHHVADALIEELKQVNESAGSKKIDILSYSYGKIEQMVSSMYLNSIQYIPDFYDKLYRGLAGRTRKRNSRHYHYELLFMPFFKKMIRQHRPDVLFLTHCLPSNIADVLKKQGKLDAVTVNVYTDYFVNNVWGLESVDYHFAPSKFVKNDLIDAGVDASRIFVTGIPVHRAFRSSEIPTRKNNKKIILVTGGSLGTGQLEKILPEDTGDLHFIVLCGTNKLLYEHLRNRQHPHIEPIPYIHSKYEMNQLYDASDAVVAKAGGVTISESLIKRKPLFISSALPGPERVNVQRLQEMGLLLEADGTDITGQLTAFLSGSEEKRKFDEKLEAYHDYLEAKPMNVLLKELLQ
jgi:UDP-N-acetylglucosamine:LPS N-acetylglucosamine transferase